MQLLILILKKVELMNKVVKRVAEQGVKGGTIIEGTGMAQTLGAMQELPIFGLLRQISSSDGFESSKIALFVLKDDQVMPTRKAINEVVDLHVANSGIMFSIPITYVEGLGE